MELNTAIFIGEKHAADIDRGNSVTDNQEDRYVAGTLLAIVACELVIFLLLHAFVYYLRHS